MFKKAKKGFTIVELVIVIAVIGILSAILIPTFANLTTQAQQTALKSNLNEAYAMYAAEAADREIKSVSDSSEVKVADIEFVGQEKVFLVEAKKEGDTAYDPATAEGYIRSGKEWATTKTPFNTAFADKARTLVSDTVALSTFGGFVFYYAK